MSLINCPYCERRHTARDIGPSWGRGPLAVAECSAEDAREVDRVFHEWLE